MRYPVVAALAAWALLVPAPFVPGALAQSAAPPNLMANWSLAEMHAVLVEGGATIASEGVMPSGNLVLRAKSDTGMNFSVYGAQCDSADQASKRCTGAEFQASFTLKPGLVTKALSEIDYAAIGYYSSNDDLIVSRYVIFDNGIARDNLKVNLRVFLNISAKVWQSLTTKGYMN